ncbi:hypothetical protein [Heyndrickxia acidicola]|uniref:Uncharacterized protein n=1 Tax=Heyndrickxia acidicola TaxID=209389 RepID=A0ABU6MNR3_9BACI|nr:hypothetical protein [Heyndrickxia acidicola]MED1205273.1 hypothetical protein [Heyndrickxia acidicola]
MKRKARDSCGKSWPKGDPAGACDEAPGRPREASACAAEINQQDDQDTTNVPETAQC